jgi:urease accessory protein
MAWQGTLQLHYQRRGDHSVAFDRHDGPLRVLRALYPEGPGVCHHVLVHPPGGLVSGDDLRVELDLGRGSHALVTTPGATRFYRSAGATATQRIYAHVQADARLEWLPLETILHDHADGHNSVRFTLEPGAQMMGWDMLALGLPASGEAFSQGSFEQTIEWPGLWLERGLLDLRTPGEIELTRRRLSSPLGWGGRSVLATMWLASGTPWSSQELNGLLDAARAACPPDGQSDNGSNDRHINQGITSPHHQLLVLRVLAPRTEMAWPLLRAVRDVWRHHAWSMPTCAPRVWST